VQPQKIAFSFTNYLSTVTARFFHGIIVLIVLSISVRSVRKTLAIVNVDQSYSPQEAGQN
jgi:hypothetical protein